MRRKNLCRYGYYHDIEKKGLVRYSTIKRVANWEMSRCLLIAPEMSLHQNNMSAFLLGIMIILYLIEVKMLKWHKTNFKRHHCSASRKMFTCSYQLKSKIIVFYLMSKHSQDSNKLQYKVSDYIFHSEPKFFRKKLASDENLVTVVKVLLFVFLPYLLIIAGDVELNPGPHTQELFKNLLKDFFLPLQSKYAEFGIHLVIPFTQLKVFEQNYDGQTSKIISEILHYWLNNCDERIQFSVLRGALAGLNRNDLVNVLEKKYTSLPFEAIADHKENCKKAFDDIMKSEKQVIKVLFAKLIFLGPPERGKTLTRLRLEEVMENTESDPKYKNNPSTPVAEGEIYLLTDLSRTAAVASETGWRSLKGIVEEVKLMYELIYKLKQETGDSMDSKSQSTKMDYPQQSVKNLSKEKHPKNQLDTSIGHFAEMFDKSMASSHSWEELSSRLEDLCLLYMKDTGGQPELMDLLPALIIGPALYLLFCKLGEDLDKTYKVCLRGIPNTTISDRMSSCTVRENFVSALSSIFSMHSYSARNKPEAEGKFDKVLQDTPDSIVYVVGTYKDEVSADKIVQFDEEMQKVIEDTVFYEKGLVHFVSRDGFEPSDPKDIMPEGQDRLIYPIDNHLGTKREIKGFQKFILKALNTFPRTEIPAHWLPFSLLLRSVEKKYIELHLCYEYGKQYGMEKKETDIALWFFHYRIGIIMHFPNVPELKDYVIIDTQFIFDSFSNLIFENGISMAKAAGNMFRKVGQISFDDIKKISGEIFPPNQMEALLKHLNVIAPLNKPLTGRLSFCEQQLYFMPCVLENYSNEKLKEIVKSTKSEVTTYSIKLCYECGFAPIGVFPAMIAKVVGQPSSTGIHAFKLSDKDEMKKNLIKFTYGKDRHKVVFISTATYYEIIVIQPTVHDNTTDSQVCTEVRERIECILKSMSDNSGSLLHNVESICGSYRWAFDCPDHPEDDHLCVVEIGDDSPSKMECQMSGEWIAMEERHQVWFCSQDYICSYPKRQCKKENLADLPMDYHLIYENISEKNHAKLKCDINSDNHIRRIAEKMTKWEEKYDLLHLNKHEVHNIQHGENKGRPVLQQIKVLHTWKDKFVYPTYECLLQILVKGGFTDCVSEMVTIINENWTEST